MQLEAHPGEGLLNGLGADARAVLTVVGRLEPRAHLVGGTVRDLLLGTPSRDLDIVTETPVGALGRALRAELGGRLVCHAAFLTCTLTLPAGVLDLAGARTEHYPRPGALPVVTPGPLAADLYRRDFSVNTFALALGDPHTLLSVPGAGADLEARLLRVLHKRSFFDDPTRVVRGSRLAGRLGFEYDPQTRGLLGEALAAGVHRQVSSSRLKNELLLTLAEPRVAPAAAHLAASGALAALYGLPDTPLVARLDRLRAAEGVPDEGYLLALLLGASDAGAEAFVMTFDLPKRLLASRKRLKEDPAAAKTPSEGAVARVLGVAPPPEYPRVRGEDVLSLGLSAGPEVGRILRLVEQARRAGRVASFADELELAKGLVRDTLAQETR